MSGNDAHRGLWSDLQQEVRQRQSDLDGKIDGWCRDYADGGGRIFCGKGCANCCTLNVQTTLTEALAIAAVLTPEQETALSLYVERLKAVMGDVADLKTFLRRHRKEIGPCPFVDVQGSCGIYAQRPFSCRALLSTRPSDWCAVDFAELEPIDRTLFMNSLDRSVVAFPTHYVEATQEWARDLEDEARLRMIARFGVGVSGNLGYLIHLERRYGLAMVVADGHEAVAALLRRESLDHPFVIFLHI